MLRETEGILLEPSAIAGAPGPARVLADADYLSRMGLGAEKLAAATHIVWATGGSMVPPEEMAKYTG